MGSPLFHKRPTIPAAAVFLLALSGPPRLRIRDPSASLRGDLDWVVILHLVVWGSAGFWVLWQLAKRFQAKRPLLRLRLPQILALALVLCLAASTAMSVAPALTAFKVYQLLISILLTQFFIDRFGAQTTLNTMLWGNTLLCVAIAICAFLAPDLVWAPSDFNPEPTRLFGALIAPTGVVSVLAIILLLTSGRKICKPLPLSLFVSFLLLLALSLMRTAYIAAFVFLGLVLLKRPNLKPLRRFAYVLCGLLLMLYACGWLPSLSQYRDPQSISTLSDRTGLWSHLTEVTLNQSPWFGLGYYSASRMYGLEYNPGLGTAHSIFLEVLSGGGLVSCALLVALCVALSIYAIRLLFAGKDRLSFAISSLFIISLLFAAMGDGIDSGPVAVSFWCAAATLPRLYGLLLKREPRRAESGKYLFARALRGV